jgi:hypothetical protein
MKPAVAKLRFLLNGDYIVLLACLGQCRGRGEEGYHGMAPKANYAQGLQAQRGWGNSTNSTRALDPHLILPDRQDLDSMIASTSVLIWKTLTRFWQKLVPRKAMVECPVECGSNVRSNAYPQPWKGDSPSAFIWGKSILFGFYNRWKYYRLVLLWPSWQI